VCDGRFEYPAVDLCPRADADEGVSQVMRGLSQTEFDERANESVGIYEVESKFAKARDTKQSKHHR
jgi:hypothetical protein